MKDVLRDATVIGLATLASGAALQGMYKFLDWYPHRFVFYFFTGATAFAGIEILEHMIGKELLLETSGQSDHMIPATPTEAPASTVAGYGETAYQRWRDKDN